MYYIKKIQDIIPATATHCIFCHPPQQSLLSVEYTCHLEYALTSALTVLRDPQEVWIWGLV